MGKFKSSISSLLLKCRPLLNSYIAKFAFYYEALQATLRPQAKVVGIQFISGPLTSHFVVFSTLFSHVGLCLGMNFVLSPLFSHVGLCLNKFCVFNNYLALLPLECKKGDIHLLFSV